MIHHFGRISIIGAGTLGSTIAYSLMMKNLAQELLLVDMSNKILQGQVLDLTEAAEIHGSTTIIRAGTLKEAGQSTLIIFTADIPKDHQWHIKSRQLLLSIASSMSPVHKDILILVTSEPNDLYVHSLQTYFPHVQPNQIFGIGTALPTCRFTSWLKTMHMEDSITDCFCIGNLELPIVVWNYTKINGIPLIQLPNVMTQKQHVEKFIISNHRNLLISERKGTTCFNLASLITNLVQEILLESTNKTWVLSVYLPQYDCCFSWPVILHKSGIKKLLDLPLSSDEQIKILQVAQSNIKIFEDSYKE